MLVKSEYAHKHPNVHLVLVSSAFAISAHTSSLFQHSNPTTLVYQKRVTYKAKLI